MLFRLKYKKKNPNLFKIRVFVPLQQLITNQVYIGFKNLYDLKPVLEQAGLYPFENLSKASNPIQIG